MNMLISSGQGDAARRVFQSAQIFTYLACATVALLVLAFTLLPVSLFDDVDAKNALSILISSVLIGQIGGLAESVFKATNGYAIGTALASTTRLAEWLGYMVGLMISANFVGVAIGGLAGRLIFFAVSVLLSSRRHGHLKWGVSEARWEEIRIMLRPAFSFLLFTLSNAFTFQGFTLLSGLLLGPAATVIFSTYRTLARVAVQASSVLSHALWPEFTALFGQGRPALLRSIYKRSSVIGLSIAAVISLVLFLVSAPLLAIWTHDSVTLQPLLMSLLLGYAAIAGLGHLPRVILMATNNHEALGLWVATVSIVSIALGWLLGATIGLIGLAIAMNIAEIVTVAVSLVLVRRLLRKAQNTKVGQFA